jgi:hypothetical protein
MSEKTADVLLCTDSESRKLSAGKLLQNINLTVEIAGTANEAIEKIQAGTYRMVILIFNEAENYHRVPDVVEDAIDEGIEHIMYDNVDVHPNLVELIEQGRIIWPHGTSEEIYRQIEDIFETSKFIDFPLEKLKELFDEKTQQLKKLNGKIKYQKKCERHRVNETQKEINQLERELGQIVVAREKAKKEVVKKKEHTLEAGIDLRKIVDFINGFPEDQIFSINSERKAITDIYHTQTCRFTTLDIDEDGMISFGTGVYGLANSTISTIDGDTINWMLNGDEKRRHLESRPITFKPMLD